jgi:hypothetical protein
VRVVAKRQRESLFMIANYLTEESVEWMDEDKN